MAVLSGTLCKPLVKLEIPNLFSILEYLITKGNDLRSPLEMLGAVPVNVVVRTEAILQLRRYDHTRPLCTCTGTEHDDTAATIGERGLDIQPNSYPSIHWDTRKADTPLEARRQH